MSIEYATEFGINFNAKKSIVLLQDCHIFKMLVFLN